MAGIKHQKLDQRVYGEVKKLILDGKLPPGERVRQSELAERLGVSKTPLLSALRMLENERLVVSIPRRGYYVRSVTVEEMAEIYEIRMALEGLAARRAANRITEAQKRRLLGFFNDFAPPFDAAVLDRYTLEDRRYHEFIIQVAGGDLLSDIVGTFNVMMLRYRAVNRDGQVRGPDETLEEHRRITDAICHHDPDRAEEMMRIHVGRSQARLVEEMANEAE